MLTQQLRILATCLFHPDDIVEVRHLLIGNVPGASSQFFKASRLHRGMESIEHYNLGRILILAAIPRRQWGGMKSEDVAAGTMPVCGVGRDDLGAGLAANTVGGHAESTLVLWSGGGRMLTGG